MEDTTKVIKAEKQFIILNIYTSMPSRTISFDEDIANSSDPNFSKALKKASSGRPFFLVDKEFANHVNNSRIRAINKILGAGGVRIRLQSGEYMLLFPEKKLAECQSILDEEISLFNHWLNNDADLTGYERNATLNLLGVHTLLSNINPEFAQKFQDRVLSRVATVDKMQRNTDLGYSINVLELSMPQGDHSESVKAGALKHRNDLFEQISKEVPKEIARRMSEIMSSLSKQEGKDLTDKKMELVNRAILYAEDNNFLNDPVIDKGISVLKSIRAKRQISSVAIAEIHDMRKVFAKQYELYVESEEKNDKSEFVIEEL